MKVFMEESKQMLEQTDLNIRALKTEKRAVYIDIYLADKYLFIRKISWKSIVKHGIMQLSGNISIDHASDMRRQDR